MYWLKLLSEFVCGFITVCVEMYWLKLLSEFVCGFITVCVEMYWLRLLSEFVVLLPHVMRFTPYTF
jgi:hypothetical protein